jgi:hypothetical protein
MFMKNKINIGVYIILLAAFVIAGCERMSDIAIVKNNSAKSIFIIYTLGKLVTDESVAAYYNDLKEYLIEPDSSKKLSTFNRILKSEPDSSKIYLYIFNVDSLNKYKKASHFKGIVAHSLVKYIEIQVNKVNEPVDTIYVNKR